MDQKKGKYINLFFKKIGKTITLTEKVLELQFHNSQPLSLIATFHKEREEKKSDVIFINELFGEKTNHSWRQKTYMQVETSTSGSWYSSLT